MTRYWIVAVMLAMAMAGATRGEEFAFHTYAGKPAEWYRTDDGRRLAENVLSYQFDTGAWPKNIDMAAKACAPGAREGLKKSHWQTIDNGATYGQMPIMARAFEGTGDERYRASFLKGLDYLLAAQYPTGGWPQCFPLAGNYHDYITFNDDAMVGVMELLRDIHAGKYPAADGARRARAGEAFDRGVACILKCQIVAGGVRTAWCQQHDAATLAPRPARAYEKVSICTGESAGIVRLLMGIDRPTPEVREAIDAACGWMGRVKITGVRVAGRDGDKVVEADTSAEPVWARCYEIGTDRPLFCGRDGVIKYTLAEIERERRTGYAWYGTWPARVLGRDWPAWKGKWGTTPATAPATAR